MSGSGAHWPGEACHTVWAELLKPLELDVLFHPGCRGSLVLKQPFPSIQEDTTHPNHPWRPRVLRDQAERTGMELSTLGGCWEVALLGLWCSPGEHMGSRFPPDSISAPGALHPELLPAAQSGKQHGCLDSSCMTWGQGTSRESPGPVEPVCFPNPLRRLTAVSNLWSLPLLTHF